MAEDRRAMGDSSRRRFGGNWRRKNKAERNSHAEMDFLEAQFTHGDVQKLDHLAAVFVEESEQSQQGETESEDSFKHQVIQKTHQLCIGRQEAETEVFIDKMVDRLGNKDLAMIYVTSEMTSEAKVQILVTTLLHRGADPSTRNKKLRTPLHFAVQKNFRGVAAKLLEHDARPYERDNDGVLPLRIAIDSGNDEMAALLINYMPNWIVRGLFISEEQKSAEFSFHFLLRSGLLNTALSVLDCQIEPAGSFRNEHIRAFYQMLEADDSGRPPEHELFQKLEQSAFQLIAERGTKSIVYHDVVRLLIRRKWKRFARTRFIFNSIAYSIALMALTVSGITCTLTDDVMEYTSDYDIARVGTDVISYAMAWFFFFTECNEFRKHPRQYFTDRANLIELPAALLIMSVLPLRLTTSRAHWYVFSLGYLLSVLRVFKYAAIFRQTGMYTQILWCVITHDFIQFTAVFMVILLGFAGSFLLALKGDDNLHTHNETSTFLGILFVGVRTLTEAQPVLDYTGPDGYRVVSTILMVCFLFVTCVILLNILIAQLSDTYQNVQADAQRCLEVNRAWNISRVELNSWCHGQRNRLTHYVPYEDINDIRDALEKWESPPLNEMNKYVRDIWDCLDTQSMNILTLKNRLARQEFTLLNIQNSLERLEQRGDTTTHDADINTTTDGPQWDLSYPTVHDPAPKGVPDTLRGSPIGEHLHDEVDPDDVSLELSPDRDGVHGSED